jgi:methylated-DNA-[protein]-cysteine S-methyltransferase
MDDAVAIRTTLAGPWGPVHVAATDRGIVAVEWLTTEAAFDEALGERLGGRVVPAKPARSFGGHTFGRRERHLAAGVKAVETFLAGRQPKFDVGLDLADRPLWDRRVLAVVAAIPWGQTASYGEIARRVGAPRGARAVGGALGRNPISFLIPCHRVIAADGTLGGWGGDRWGDLKHRLAMKRTLLLREGVTVATGDG